MFTLVLNSRRNSQTGKRSQCVHTNASWNCIFTIVNFKNEATIAVNRMEQQNIANWCGRGSQIKIPLNTIAIVIVQESESSRFIYVCACDG